MILRHDCFRPASIVFFAALLAGAPQPMKADELVSGLSTDVVEITSNFNGSEIVLFGAIETSESIASPAGRDIVVVVRGPDEDFTIRRKERVAGIWINRKQIEFSGMPGYYFLASTRPLEQIASRDILARFRLGTANLEAITPPRTHPAQAALFKEAAVRNKKKQGLYSESPAGIEFLSQSLFRTRIRLPAAVPPGQYRAEVYLFRGGSVVSAQSTPLFIDKSGLERRLYDFAYREAFLYGLASVLMAVTLGWLAFLAFRQRTIN